MSARPINAARAAYEPAIQRFLPGCEGRELMLRASMMMLRDQAGARMQHCSDEAYGVLQQVQRLGLHHALASMQVEVLDEIRGAMVRLAAQASVLEGIFGGLVVTLIEGKAGGGRG